MKSVEKNKAHFYAKYTLPIILVCKIIIQKKVNKQNGYATPTCRNFYLHHNISEQLCPISGSNPIYNKGSISGYKTVGALVSHLLASNPKVQNACSSTFMPSMQLKVCSLGTATFIIILHYAL
jgi:hypothetical protein